ncbi:unnamed protein product, partial [Didymodactylos carnosus]
MQIRLYTPLTFEMVCNTCLSDIVLQFVEGDHGDGAPFDEKTLAHAFLPTDGRIHLDSQDTWTELYNSTSKTLKQRSDVLTSIDQQSIQALYGKKAEADSPTTTTKNQTTRKLYLFKTSVNREENVLQDFCTPFWTMPSGEIGIYRTYRNANTLISGDSSRSACTSFNATKYNDNNIVFSIGSRLTTWSGGENMNFALAIRNGTHVDVFGMQG